MTRAFCQHSTPGGATSGRQVLPRSCRLPVAGFSTLGTSSRDRASPPCGCRARCAPRRSPGGCAARSSATASKAARGGWQSPGEERVSKKRFRGLWGGCARRTLRRRRAGGRRGRAWGLREAGAAAGLEEAVSRALARLRSAHAPAPTRGTPAGPSVRGEVHEEEPPRFLRVVEATLEAIGRGDVYQANLSRRWRAQLAPGMDEGELYRRLRAANPAPFAGIARLPGFSVLSSSPERLMSIENGIASTRPIAGTRPRGRDARADAELRADLRLNEKERAEHVMLVDLERNDLGRICRAGSVKVDEFMTIESYAHVHHIVSNVRGELADGITPGRAIAAVFPGGTITGCPKVRCMQLLADLEAEPRDAYTGSMGYLSIDGTLDLNILIRTITVDDGAIEFRTGAGIVADSSPAAELEETRAKARGLLRALGSNA